jgi:hypothetical protein
MIGLCGSAGLGEAGLLSGRQRCCILASLADVAGGQASNGSMCGAGPPPARGCEAAALRVDSGARWRSLLTRTYRAAWIGRASQRRPAVRAAAARHSSGPLCTWRAVRHRMGAWVALDPRLRGGTKEPHCGSVWAHGGVCFVTRFGMGRFGRCRHVPGVCVAGGPGCLRCVCFMPGGDVVRGSRQARTEWGGGRAASGGRRVVMPACAFGRVRLHVVLCHWPRSAYRAASWRKGLNHRRARSF